jgi:galactokinase
LSKLNQQAIQDLFTAFYGQAPEHIVSAPGRVNLIGEHTDYNGGFVLPAAINYHTWIAGTADSSRQLEVVAWNFDNQRVLIDLDQPMVADSAALWSNYVRGVIQQLLQHGLRLTGGELYIGGDVPAGAGLSSSASLEMAVIRALTAMSGETIDPTRAALLGQAAENHFVGCNCGIMDQLISARGQENHALLIDCQDLSTRTVSIPQDWEILIVHSGVKRGLVDSEYNQRRQQCEAAAAVFGATSLREVSLGQLLDKQAEMEPLAFRRARHVLTENARTLKAADALAAGDIASLMQVMAESHASMRDDFNITVPAIDTLVDILNRAGNGQAGVRMTGGGFGGCVVAIAPAVVIPALMHAVNTDYQKLTGCEPALIRAKASGGAFQ